MSGLPALKYSGRIREISIGKPGSEITLGGETGYNFYSFEGLMPNTPKLALQILDIEPEEWAAEALEPYKDVLSDPVAWAKKAAEEYRADVVALWLAGTDPNGRNLSADHAAQVAKSVAQNISVPLIVWGVSSDEKNTEVLKAVAEACAGFNLVIGPVTEGNYKQLGAAAIAYKHVVAANTPIDINLAKQLNILLENLGVPTDRILIDPTTGAVGYGLEYCYSIMERIRQAALTQNDDKLQYPIINNIAEEVWKTKEAKISFEADMKLGNPSLRGINLETVTALSCLQAGSDLLILRHPRTLNHIRAYIAEISQPTDLDSMEVDLSLVPTPKEEKAPQKEKVVVKAAQTTPAEVSEAAASAGSLEQPSPAVTKQPEVESLQSQPTEQARDETRSELPYAPPAPPISESVPAPAAPTETADVVTLTDEDIQALREMLAMFRAVRNLFASVAKLMQG